MQETEFDCLERKFEEREGWNVLRFPTKLNDVVLDSRTTRKLTDDERKDRKIWSKLRKEWRIKQPIFHTETSSLLKSRVLPPLLNQESVNTAERSSSCTKRSRSFPPTEAVQVWSEFDKNARDFEPTCSFLEDIEEIEDPWRQSGNNHTSCGDEKSEQVYMQYFVLEPLRQAGLLHFIDSDTGPHGLADLVLREPNSTRESGKKTIIVTVEFKATHKLWLPEATDDLVQSYRQAYEDKKLKTCVLHPIGQVVRSMVINETVFGVLSSAARTYFLQLMTKGVCGKSELVLKISRRWYTGEKNYMCAWAWLYRLALDSRWNDSYSAARHWPRSTPEKLHVRRSDRIRQWNSSGSDHNIDANIVLWENIHFTDVTLGCGQHGPVYEALYQNKLVAVKVFNVEEEKGRGQFECELQAYNLLKSVQGKLVPRLFFQSEHWTGSLKALALERGRSVNPAIDLYAEQDKVDVLHSLRDFGFEHRDCDEFRNFIYIFGDSGEERMVAIDLEYLEPVLRDTSVSSEEAATSLRWSSSDSSAY